MRVVIVAAAIALSCLSVYTNAETLNRQQAVERALQTDPRLDERRSHVEFARAQLQEAQGSDDLFIDFNGFVGISPGVQGSFFKQGGCNPGTQCELRDDRFDLNQGVSLWNYLEAYVIKPVYTFGKVENFSTAAKANIRVKEGDVRLQRGQTILDVNRAYFGYLAARDGRLFLEDVQKRIDGAVDLVKKWLDEGSGDVTQSDLFALQTGAAIVAKNLAQARSLETISLAGLRLLTGVDTVEVSDHYLAPLPAPEGALEALTETARQRRPEAVQLEAGLQARRALVEGQKAMARPNVFAGVSGLWSYSPQRERVNNPYIYDPFNDWGVTPMVGLQWYWQKGAQDAKVAQAKAELNGVIAQAALADKGIPFQVAEQYYNVQANHEAVEKMAEGSRSGRRWMITIYADFQAGLVEAQKVVTAFQGYVLAHSDYLRTVFDYNMSVVQLENVIGAYE